MEPKIYSDNYLDYYAVMEQTTDPGQGFKMIKECNEHGLHFLRFSATLQSFGRYNRNRRKWEQRFFEQMLAMECVTEPLRKKAFVGEAGHPVAPTGKISLERILNIDPLRTSHRVTDMSWKGNILHGTIETLDEGEGTPGRRLMMNILQGILPAWSARTVVPQRHNSDGTIDVIGPGRMVCYDRVYLPSHEEAYLDEEIPIKEIVSNTKFETVMESFVGYIAEQSDKIRRITDTYDSAMESVSYDPKRQLMGVRVDGGMLFAAPELKYRKELNAVFSEL